MATLAAAATVAVASPQDVRAVLKNLGDGTPVGSIVFTDSDYGLLVRPDLANMEPGMHAVHVHQNADCGESGDGIPAGNAGGHYDPANTGKHEGPYGSGHLGDLPNITVEADGTATVEVLAPRVRAQQLSGRAIVVHAGADRYDTHSGHRHGKGGMRMYCGIIQ